MRNPRNDRSKDIGDRSEALMLARFLQLGWTVLKPFGDNQRYDLVIERGQGFERIQVKTAWIRGGALLFSSCSSYSHRGRGKQGYRGQIEHFGVFSPDLDRYFLVPVEAVPESHGWLRVAPPKNNRARKCHMAEEFELTLTVSDVGRQRAAIKELWSAAEERSKPVCEHCDRPAVGPETLLCGMHYQRFRTHGTHLSRSERLANRRGDVVFDGKRGGLAQMVEQLPVK